MIQKSSREFFPGGFFMEWEMVSQGSSYNKVPHEKTGAPLVLLIEAEIRTSIVIHHPVLWWERESCSSEKE